MQYRLGGRGSQTKRVTLGKHGVLTPEQARKLAREKLGEVANGVDIAEHRKEERAKLAGLTFAEASRSSSASMPNRRAIGRRSARGLSRMM